MHFRCSSVFLSFLHFVSLPPFLVFCSESFELSRYECLKPDIKCDLEGLEFLAIIFDSGNIFLWTESADRSISRSLVVFCCFPPTLLPSVSPSPLSSYLPRYFGKEGSPYRFPTIRSVGGSLFRYSGTKQETCKTLHVLTREICPKLP